MLAGLDVSSRAMVVATLARRPPFFTAEHFEPQRCPACPSEGWLVCAVERGEVEDDAAEDGYNGAFVARTAISYAFEYPVCELDLAPSEFGGLGFPELNELEEEYGESGEADEDLYRDR